MAKRTILGGLIAAAATVALLAGCGPAHHVAPTTKATPPAVYACPSAAEGKGAVGICAKSPVNKAPTLPGATVKAPVSTLAVAASVVHVAGNLTYPDLSNNDPTYNMSAIKRAGHPAVDLKVNQGTRFLDGTFLGMANAAKDAGLSVGGYDFDELYTADEAYAFVYRLHAAGIYAGTLHTLPPTLDVEYGNANRAGLEHQIAVLKRTFGRVEIYTGAWYWTPHFGCWIPSGVTFWLSGYPTATKLCGLTEDAFNVHQYSDAGFNGSTTSDMNVFRGNKTQFNSFAKLENPEIPKKRAQLAKDIKYRNELRVLLTKRQCRVIHGKEAYPACPTWAHEGRVVNKQIKQLQKELA